MYGTFLNFESDYLAVAIAPNLFHAWDLSNIQQGNLLTQSCVHLIQTMIQWRIDPNASLRKQRVTMASAIAAANSTPGPINLSGVTASALGSGSTLTISAPIGTPVTPRGGSGGSHSAIGPPIGPPPGPPPPV